MSQSTLAPSVHDHSSDLTGGSATRIPRNHGRSSLPSDIHNKMPFTTPKKQSSTVAGKIDGHRRTQLAKRAGHPPDSDPPNARITKRASADPVSGLHVKNSTGVSRVKPAQFLSKIPPSSTASRTDSRVGVALQVQKERTYRTPGDARRKSSTCSQSKPLQMENELFDAHSSWDLFSTDEEEKLARLKKLLQTDLKIRLPSETKKLALELSNGKILTNWLNHILGPSLRLKYPFPLDVPPNDQRTRAELIKHLRRCKELMSVRGVPKEELFLIEPLVDANSPLGILSLATAIERLRSHSRNAYRDSTTVSRFPSATTNGTTHKSSKSPDCPEPSRKASNAQASLVSPSSAWPQHLCSDV
ncbi:hypothetical protein FGIG_04494 [Fasciola gigantica]|uniref:Uncharacterized protein n=1 Tax=Fasciola gigantica TaxID=46835 RepID=A0A504Z046_FASGI|nr:hypothetical protein FGIG_04494 [Fasciola gigantica]